jgi:hypothetical protein
MALSARYTRGVNHPGMTSRGRMLAILAGLVIAFLLPKRVECGHPAAGTSCQRFGPRHQLCTPYEVEPWGFFLIEMLVRRDVGFAYKSGDDCR